MPLRGSILQDDSCSIFSLAENPKCNQVWQNGKGIVLCEIICFVIGLSVAIRVNLLGLNTPKFYIFFVWNCNKSLLWVVVVETYFSILLTKLNNYFGSSESWLQFSPCKQNKIRLYQTLTGYFFLL